MSTKLSAKIPLNEDPIFEEDKNEKSDDSSISDNDVEDDIMKANSGHSKTIWPVWHRSPDCNLAAKLIWQQSGMRPSGSMLSPA